MKADWQPSVRQKPFWNGYHAGPDLVGANQFGTSVTSLRIATATPDFWDEQSAQSEINIKLGLLTPSLRAVSCETLPQFIATL